VELIEKVGAYVGLLAFLGFAVLAFLYFSQARDVRRLRDWAGHAPERMEAAAHRMEGSYQESVAEPAGERVEAPAEHEQAEAPAGEEGPPPAYPPSGAPPPRPAQVGQPQHQPQYQRPTSTSALERVLPGAAVPGTTPRHRGRRRRGGLAARLPEPRYLAVIGGGVLLLAAGVLGATSLLGGDEGGKGSGGSSSAPVSPGQVTVAILNGTSVPGAAAQIGEQVRQDGYKLGPVTNSSSSFDESVVMFAPGHEREARFIARDVKITDVRAMTPEIAGLSGEATVAVVVGQDRASE